MAATAPLPPHDDPILRALDVLRSRSGFLVMREAFYGTRRFDDFARRVDLSPSSLAARLRSLVAEGLLQRVPYQEEGARARHEYVLTEKGEALLPALVGLLRWANDYLPPAERGMDLVHADCGTPAAVEIRCRSRHKLSLKDLRAERT